MNAHSRRMAVSAAGPKLAIAPHRAVLGCMIGRPSLLQLEVNTDNEVFVGGEVIELGSGILKL